MLDDSRVRMAAQGRKPHSLDDPATQRGESAPDREHAPLKSRVIKRSIVIGGHRTSVSLEDAFWEGLKQIAHESNSHISDIVCAIDGGRQHCNLSSAIRLYVFSHFHK